MRGPDGKIAKSAEHRLLQNLIYSSSYNREVRPVLNDDDVMRVTFTLKLVQIVDVVSCDWLRLDLVLGALGPIFMVWVLCL